MTEGPKLDAWNAPTLTGDEAALLTAVGYIVMKWNYAERSARHIVQMYPNGMSDHRFFIKLSQMRAEQLVGELRAILPKWVGEGQPYLERLVTAFSIAREHRNHLVHGVWATHSANVAYPAKAILVPAMPHRGEIQVPEMMSLADIQPLVRHIHDLAMFGRDVSVAFDKFGNRALNPDGTPALEELPPMITPMPARQSVTA